MEQHLRGRLMLPQARALHWQLISDRFKASQEWSLENVLPPSLPPRCPESEALWRPLGICNALDELSQKD